MAFKCKNCGGNVHYSIESGDLCCSYCNARFSIDEYEKNDAEYKKDAFETNIFVCPTCGAELSSLDEESTAYCAYCGTQAVLKEKQIKNKPTYIIPFEQTPEKAKQKYADFIRKKLFVPNELKDPNYINEFRGIYIPHWSYAIETNHEPFIIKGKKSYTSGSYDYVETYNINVQIQNNLYDIVLDASEALDDTIASEIAPYQISGAVKFNEGYLAGFYADKETTPPEKYNDEINEIAADKINKEIKGRTKLRITSEPTDGQLFTGRTAHRLALLPVWFLTYRKKDRVAYSVVNGQTGKMAMDLPVDKKKFFITAGIVGTILSIMFFLLSSAVLPQNIVTLTEALTFISSMVYLAEIKKIQKRENVGYKSNLPIVGPIIAMLIAFVLCSILLSRNHGPIVTLTISVLQCMWTFKTIKRIETLKNKSGIKYTIIALVLMLVGSAISIINPVADEWFYIAATANIVGMLSNCFAAIHYFNDLTTRPVPNFFTRKGGFNHEEN